MPPDPRDTRTLAWSGNNLAAGVRSFGPVPVPLGAKYFRLEIDVTDLVNPEQRILVVPEISLDGGATWQVIFNCGIAGGTVQLLKRDGTPRTDGPPWISVLDMVSLGASPETIEVDSTNPNRMLRCTATFTAPAGVRFKMSAWVVIRF